MPAVEARTHATLVEGLGFDFALLLETVDDVAVRPSDLVRQTLDGTELASRLCASVMARCPPTHLESEHAKGLRHDDALLVVVRRRDTLEELDALESGGTSAGLVRDHTADRTVEDARRSALVERSALLRVDQVLLVQEGVVTKLKSSAPACSRELTFMRKNEPETLISSHRTTTIFCPESACFATMLANRPSRCPLPSMTIGLLENS